MTGPGGNRKAASRTSLLPDWLAGTPLLRDVAFDLFQRETHFYFQERVK